jgi:hypothetical protein
MIFKTVSPKKLTFFAETIASFCKKLIMTLDFEINANFFAENWQKSPKIVTITLTPDPSDRLPVQGNASDLFSDSVGCPVFARLLHVRLPLLVRQRLPDLGDLGPI